MTTFEFSGKVYRVVEDVVGELVAGCERCAFYNDNDDYRCAEVDGGFTGRTRCIDGNHHYEEATPQPS